MSECYDFTTIVQDKPFRRFTYITAHSPTLISLLLGHRIFTYVAWRTAHATFSLRSHKDPFAFFTALPRHSDQKISMKCYLILCKLHRTLKIFLKIILCRLLLRPGAHQSSKAAFGKSAFAKTCYNVLSFVKDTTGAHQSSKKQKYFRARFGTCNEQNAFCENVPNMLDSIFAFCSIDVRQSYL